jgi:hypothetical protein
MEESEGEDKGSTILKTLKVSEHRLLSSDNKFNFWFIELFILHLCYSYCH